METYQLQALRLSLSLHGSAPEDPSQRAIKWKAQGSLTPQELTLKFQEWLASRNVTSLLEAEFGELEKIEEALQKVELTAGEACPVVEAEFNAVLKSSPLLGYDVTGNAVVRQSPVWIQRADDLFQDLDSENRGYLVADSLCYFVLALHPSSTRDPRHIRFSLSTLLPHLPHSRGQVSRLAFKLYLLRYGHSTLQAVTTLQVRVKHLARGWGGIKALAARCDGALLSFCNHFALSGHPLPSVIEQSIQLALPVSYLDYAATAEFLRLQLPGSVLTDRGSDFTDIEEVVERLASGYSGGLSESVILVFCKTVTIFDRLTDETLGLLLGMQSQPPVSQSNVRTAKHSPVRGDSTEKTMIRMSPSYSRQTVASTLKNVRNQPPPTALLNSLLNTTKDQDPIPRVRLSICDLHGSLRRPRS